MDPLLGSKQARELVLEPATQEDIEAELEEFEPGVVTSNAPVASYRLVVQAKLRTANAWTVAKIKALLRHGKKRTSVRERLKDPKVHYLLVTTAALNGGTKGLQVAQVGVWPKASGMPAAIKSALLPGSAGRVHTFAHLHHRPFAGSSLSNSAGMCDLAIFRTIYRLFGNFTAI